MRIDTGDDKIHSTDVKLITGSGNGGGSKDFLVMRSTSVTETPLTKNFQVNFPGSEQKDGTMGDTWNEMAERKLTAFEADHEAGGSPGKRKSDPHTFDCDNSALITEKGSARTDNKELVR